jgi:sporulation protein YlmC with PRC-barrel domain
MKWLLASTALALSLGLAQAGSAQDEPADPNQQQPSNTTQQPADTTDRPDSSTLPAPSAGNSATDPQSQTTDTIPEPSTIEPAAGNADDPLVIQGNTAVLATGAFSARSIVGADVIGPDGNAVGIVDDLVLSSDNSVEQVIIADGAILGFGGKNVSLDFDSSMVSRGADGDDPTVRISMTEEALDQAAEFDKSSLEEQGDRLASSYIERDVKLASSDEEGEISDLLVDQGGKVKYAVIEFGGVLDAGDSEVAVDVAKLSGAPEGEPMTLAMTPAELEAAPKLQPAADNPM